MERPRSELGEGRNSLQGLARRWEFRVQERLAQVQRRASTCAQGCELQSGEWRESDYCWENWKRKEHNFLSNDKID